MSARMPPRRHTKALESNPDLEFDFFLAAKLHMTVADLRERMSNQEWQYWSIYYARIAQREQLRAMKG